MGQEKRVLGWTEDFLLSWERGNSTLLKFRSSDTMELIPNGPLADLPREANLCLVSEGLHPFNSMGYPLTSYHSLKNLFSTDFWEY